MLSTRSVDTVADMEPGRYLCCFLCEDEEAQLLERAKAFDLAALETVYDRYAPRIYNYIYPRLGNGTSLQAVTAEDLTSQVFLHMLEAIRGGKTWKTSFSGWIFRIAHNLVVDHYRQGSRSRRVSLEDAPPLLAANGDPAEITDKVMTREQLLLAIQHLTDDQAQVVTLRFLEGLSIAEVASIMSRSEAAVKGLQYRAAVALRQLLSSQLGATEYGTPTRAGSNREGRKAWKSLALSPGRA